MQEFRQKIKQHYESQRKQAIDAVICPAGPFIRFRESPNDVENFFLDQSINYILLSDEVNSVNQGTYKIWIVG